MPLFQTTMLQSIERYMKQAIVDKNHAVASAALVSSLVCMAKCSKPYGMHLLGKIF